MTDFLKTLLHQYGLLYVTLVQLSSERPGNAHDSLDAYYGSLGVPEPEEPVLVVRVSADGETRLSSPARPDGGSSASAHVWELPDNEFYFFRAFRSGLFDLEKQLPAFLIEMAFVYSYTLFENYITEIIRSRLRTHAPQIGLRRQITYREVFESESKEDLIDRLIDREVLRLMHESIASVVERMRAKLGFRSMTREYDQAVHHLSLTRNCLLHNGGKVDAKLAGLSPSMDVGQKIELQLTSVSEAINTCRHFCAAVDREFETL